MQRIQSGDPLASRPDVSLEPIRLPCPIIEKSTRYRVRKLWGSWWAEEWLILESKGSPSRHRTEAMMTADDCGRGLSGWKRALDAANEKARKGKPGDEPLFRWISLDEANASTRASRVEPPC